MEKKYSSIWVQIHRIHVCQEHHRKLGQGLQATDAYHQEVVKTQTPGPSLAPKDSEPVNLE